MRWFGLVAAGVPKNAVDVECPSTVRTENKQADGDMLNGWTKPARPASQSALTADDRQRAGPRHRQPVVFVVRPGGRTICARVDDSTSLATDVLLEGVSRRPGPPRRRHAPRNHIGDRQPQHQADSRRGYGRPRDMVSGASPTESLPACGQLSKLTVCAETVAKLTAGQGAQSDGGTSPSAARLRSQHRGIRAARPLWPDRRHAPRNGPQLESGRKQRALAGPKLLPNSAARRKSQLNVSGALTAASAGGLPASSRPTGKTCVQRDIDWRNCRTGDESDTAGERHRSSIAAVMASAEEHGRPSCIAFAHPRDGQQSPGGRCDTPCPQPPMANVAVPIR